MYISPSGIKLITKWEGYHRRLPDGRCTTYYCPANVLTIGYGSTHGIKPGMIWTEEQAREGLRRELDDVERAVNKYVTVDLTQAQYDVLVSFAYNCGTGALRKSTLLKRLNRGDYKGAWRQLPRWRRGGGRVLQGLVNRRADEQRHWLKDIPVYLPNEVPSEIADDEPITTGSYIEDLTGGDTASEPMPQQVDEPDAPKKVLNKSRKWGIIQWLRRAFGFSAIGSASFLGASTISEAKSYLDIVKDFVAAYGLPALVVMAVLGYIAVEMLRAYQEEDVEDGRYVPSGEEAE